MKRIIVLTMSIFILGSGCQKQQTQDLVTPVVPGSSPQAAEGNAAKLAIPATQPASSPASSNPAATWIALGNDQMDAQRYQEAIVAYQKALELDPNNVDVRVDMGTCYRNIGQPERAIAEYQKGLAINPKHPNAWRNSGVVLANDLHRNAEAIKALQKYLEVSPGAADASQMLSMIASLQAAK